MKCKHCNSEMILDAGKILLSNPPKQIYTCPRCGSIVYISLDDGSIFVRVDESNPSGVVGKVEIQAPTKEEIETHYDGQDYNEMIGSNNAINRLTEFLNQVEKGENNEN